MKRLVRVLIVSFSLAIFGSAVMAVSFPDTGVPVPPGWNGPVFHLNQNYPQQVPADTYPWLQFDPTTQPDRYMFSVLQYCLEGNVQTDWVLQANAKRGWYHAP